MNVFLRPMIKSPGALFLEFELRRLVIPELSLVLTPDTGLTTRQPFYDSAYYVGVRENSGFGDGLMLELPQVPASITLQAHWHAMGKSFIHVVHYAFYDPGVLPPKDNLLMWSPISQLGPSASVSVSVGASEYLCLHHVQPCMQILPARSGPTHDDYIKDSLIIHREDSVEVPIWLDHREASTPIALEGRRDAYLTTEGYRCTPPPTVQ